MSDHDVNLPAEPQGIALLPWETIASILQLVSDQLLRMEKRQIEMERLLIEHNRILKTILESGLTVNEVEKPQEPNRYGR